MLAIFVDPRLAIAAITAIGGFFVALRWPDGRYLVQSVCSFVVGACLEWICFPLRRATPSSR